MVPGIAECVPDYRVAIYAWLGKMKIQFVTICSYRTTERDNVAHSMTVECSQRLLPCNGSMRIPRDCRAATSAPAREPPQAELAWEAPRRHFRADDGSHPLLFVGELQRLERGGSGGARSLQVRPPA